MKVRTSHKGCVRTEVCHYFDPRSFVQVQGHCFKNAQFLSLPYIVLFEMIES